MSRRAAILCLIVIAFCACKPAEEGHTTAIIGAVLIDGLGGPPLTDSVVIISGGTIRAAGRRSTVPIPADAAKVDGSGKYLAPALVDVCDRAAAAAFLNPSHPEEARAQVLQHAAAKPAVIRIGSLPGPVADAALNASRDAGIPIMARVSSAAEAKSLVSAGASGLIGPIPDRELDPSFLATLRDLQIYVAPALASVPSPPEIARRNALEAFRTGAPIVLASMGGDLVHEAEALSDAGIPPLDVIVAATRNGARALRDAADRGAIEAGKRADLLLLSANPGEDVRNLRHTAMRMTGGEWAR